MAADVYVVYRRAFANALETSPALTVSEVLQNSVRTPVMTVAALMEVSATLPETQPRAIVLRDSMERTVPCAMRLSRVGQVHAKTEAPATLSETLRRMDLRVRVVPALKEISVSKRLLSGILPSKK